MKALKKQWLIFLLRLDMRQKTWEKQKLRELLNLFACYGVYRVSFAINGHMPSNF